MSEQFPFEATRQRLADEIERYGNVGTERYQAGKVPRGRLGAFSIAHMVLPGNEKNPAPYDRYVVLATAPGGRGHEGWAFTQHGAEYLCDYYPPDGAAQGGEWAPLTAENHQRLLDMLPPDANAAALQAPQS